MFFRRKNPFRYIATARPGDVVLLELNPGTTERARQNILCEFDKIASIRGIYFVLCESAKGAIIMQNEEVKKALADQRAGIERRMTVTAYIKWHDDDIRDYVLNGADMTPREWMKHKGRDAAGYACDDDLRHAGWRKDCDPDGASTDLWLDPVTGKWQSRDAALALFITRESKGS